MNWPDAKVEAESMGGHLVAINGAEENACLLETFSQPGINESRLWIGLTDEVEENVWVWVNGDPVTYTNWWAGESNNLRNEDWVIFLVDVGDPGTWNDEPLHESRPGLVEQANPPGEAAHTLVISIEGEGAVSLSPVGETYQSAVAFDDGVLMTLTAGTSWETALFSLHDAVVLAAEIGADIWVMEGTYNIGSPVSVPSDVAIYGSFPATGTPSFERRDPNIFPTVLDGQRAATNIFLIVGVNNVRIDGFTLTRAIGGGSGFASGGAILCHSASTDVTVANCLLIDNQMSARAGGIKVHEFTITAMSCVFNVNC